MADSLLGLDIGSSSVKAVLLNATTGAVLARATSPGTELPIDAQQPGWAEQHPDLWWEHVCRAVRQLGEQSSLSGVQAIGVAYQMHGLVAVDEALKPVRPSIIWCDSRAAGLGQEAWERMGTQWCLENLLNSPGNFTAAKLAWVKRHEPDLYRRIRYMMLPGDYIAARLTGEAAISESGLSEGILWNFKEGRVAREVLECFDFPTALIPKVYPCFGVQGRIRSDVAQELGLPLNVPVTYRAGDQPNNAFSLKVLNPGEVGANAGTSGVVYGVADSVTVDQQSRVNTFLHVNSTPKAQRLGVLLCVNGAGSLSRWVKDNFSRDYQTLDRDAASSPIGARGLAFLPFGNGAERILGNRNLGASLHGIELNIHGAGDVYRAAMEGIAAALCYGVTIMGSMGVPVRSMRAGAGNMFRSPVFAQALASMVGVPIELYDTDGAEGAARGAGYGAGVFSSIEDTFKGLRVTGEVTPTAVEQYREVFARWSRVLEGQLR